MTNKGNSDYVKILLPRSGLVAALLRDMWLECAGITCRFHRNKKGKGDVHLAKKQYDGPERRRYFRHKLIYSPKEKIKLKVRNHEFEVLDISQEGFRLIDDGALPLDEHIQGILIHSDNKSRKIKGTIVWRLNNEIGIRFEPS